MRARFADLGSDMAQVRKQIYRVELEVSFAPIRVKDKG